MADAAPAPAVAPQTPPPPVVPPSGAAGHPGAQTPLPAAATWTSGITSPELRGKFELKGFKSIDDLANGYANAESLIGKFNGGHAPERTIVLPADDADGSARRAVLTKLGVPEKPEGYGFKPTDPKADPAFANKLAEFAHKHGLPLKEAQGFVGDATTLIEGLAKTQADATAASRTAAVDADVAALKTEWGEAYDGRVSTLKAACEKLIPETFEGKSRKDVIMAMESAMGPKGFAKWVYSLTEMFGEGRFVEPMKAPGDRSLTPDGKVAAIRDLSKTPGFAESIVPGSKTYNPENHRKWNALFKAA